MYLAKGELVVWAERFRVHFKLRVLAEVREKYKSFRARAEAVVNDEINHLQGTLKQQLQRDRRILKIKLQQFTRLSQTHEEAVMVRHEARAEIAETTHEYFRRQEELLLGDFEEASASTPTRVAAMRRQLADAFLYHLRRVTRSYDNQMVALVFVTAFRVIADPVVQRAVSSFSGSRALRRYISVWKRQRLALRTIVRWSALYHRYYGWTHWSKLLMHTNGSRTDGLLALVRRRREIFTRFPYFNFIDTLQVRPPRPLRDVKELFRNLPPMSIKKKVAKERDHHMSVRMVLLDRRIMRDFMRAYASYVQEQIARREVLRLMKARNRLRYLRDGYDMFRRTAHKSPLPQSHVGQERTVHADLSTWLRHFMAWVQRQKKTIAALPRE
jgi:hypothetical protein